MTGCNYCVYALRAGPKPSRRFVKCTTDTGVRFASTSVLQNIYHRVELPRHDSRVKCSSARSYKNILIGEEKMGHRHHARKTGCNRREIPDLDRSMCTGTNTNYQTEMWRLAVKSQMMVFDPVRWKHLSILGKIIMKTKRCLKSMGVQYLDPRYF